MIQSFTKRLKQKIWSAYAKQHLLTCQQLKAQPQLALATEVTNRLRLTMIATKSDLVILGAFKYFWNTRLANQYRLNSNGSSLQELCIAIKGITALLDSDYAITSDNIHATPKEILLGTYLTQHDHIFTDPYVEVMEFSESCLAYSKALLFYLDRHPEYAQFILRILSGYTLSINNVFDDLIELQCDFLSP